MRKLFSFVAAALISVAMFASREVVPSDADLASYATGTYTMCIYSDNVCNGIVLNGTYAGWSSYADHATLLDFVEVAGFDGWYVVSWNDTTGAEAKEGGVQAKPIQLDGSGLFNWDYQLGGDAELIRGTADLIPVSYYNEVDIKNIGAGIVVIDVKSWKNNPCTAVYHTYHITFISPDCNDEEFITPAISGGFNGWDQQAMTLNESRTTERQNANLPGAVFEYSVRAAEGSEFKFRSSVEWGADWSNELKEYDAENDEWKAFNGGANLVLGEETDITYDLGDPMFYSWNNCEKPEPVDPTVYYTVLWLNAPAGAPEAGIEIIGSFDWWNGTTMEKLDNGWYFVELEATGADEFRFREAGSWDNEIVYAVSDERIPNMKFKQLWQDDTYKGTPCKLIELDFSDPAIYRWSGIYYNLDVRCDNTKGKVTGSGLYKGGTYSFSATPYYGYHFTQWSDGNTDNPRTIVLTQDTTFTAEFAKNTYTISTFSADPQWGTTAGDTTAQYLDQVEISASANYGYHFVRWNDYNTSNPRMVSVTGDETYYAIFAQNIYYITKNAEHGYISGNYSAGYLDNVTLTAIPDYGYHFVRWSDGVTNNPRSFVITQDTTFTAEFVIDRTGACGDNNALTWSYDPETKTLTITGDGALSSNYTFGAEAPSNMENLIIAEGVTSIGANAFSNMSTLQTMQLPASLKTIGASAFENDINLTAIYNYRERPCLVDATAFNGVNKFDCTLYVLEGSVDMYKSSISDWKDFYFILPIGTTEVTEPVSDVTVEPHDNSATVTWPTTENAVTYTIEITKDGVVFCRLIFNAYGQLIGIAFAPGREGVHHAMAATMTTGGMQFTVTGLNSNTNYSYTVVVKDESEETISSYSGEFTTTGEDSPTGVEDIQPSEVSYRKVLRNGQIFILRGETVYTVTGQTVK